MIRSLLMLSGFVVLGVFLKADKLSLCHLKYGSAFGKYWQFHTAWVGVYCKHLAMFLTEGLARTPPPTWAGPFRQA